MEIKVAIVIGFLPLCILVTSQTQTCPELKLYDRDSEVTGFACKLFTTGTCKDGPSTFPNDLSVGASVGKPRNFEAEGFRRNTTSPQGKEFLASGLTFTWKPPIDMISRNYTKGYYLKLGQVGSGNVICRLFDLQQLDLTSSTGFHFSFELFPFTNSAPVTYLAELASLPPPTNLEYDEGLIQQFVVTIQPAHDYSQKPVVYPNDWRTWIQVTLYTTEGIVEVKFGYPSSDSQAEFTSFNVQLVESGSGRPTFEQDVIKTSLSETEGKYNFTGVTSGVYKVQVMPNDQYFNVRGKCQCWEIMNGIRTCGTCKFSITEYFNFTRVGIPSPSVSPGATTSDSSATDSVAIDSTTNDLTGTTMITHRPEGEKQTDKGQMVAVAVTVTLVTLILAAVVLAVLYKTWKLTKCQGGKDLNQNNNNQNGKSDKMCGSFISIIDITGREKDLVTPQLSKKSILLLAADDHEFFTQAVERFAGFLEVHCMCDVVFAPQQMVQLRKTGNSYCWLSRQIDSADFVIIVTSEAALRLYLAFRKGNAYTKATLGPEGDLFTPGIQHICGKITNNEDVRNVMMVYFDHTSPAFRLPIAPLPSFHYHLPSHLPSFLHHIHGLDKNRMDLSKVNLPLQGNLEELEGGKEWLDAVQGAEQYEQLHPDWFDLKFGKPVELYPSSQHKPNYSKQDSEDSGYIESRNSKELKRRLSSASNNAEEVVDETDLGVHNGSFVCTKDDFFRPSVCTVPTVYTVPYPDDDRPSEIDARSISEEFHRLNQKYEQERLQYQNPKLMLGEGSAFSMPWYDPCAGQMVCPSQEQDNFLVFTQPEEDDCISMSSVQSV